MRKTFPFIRLLPVLMIGWWMGGRFNPPDTIYLLVATAAASFILLLLAYHPRGWLSYGFRWIPGVVITGTLLVSGLQLGRNHRALPDRPFHFSKEHYARAWLLHFAEPPRVTASGKRWIADVIGVGRPDGIGRCNGRIVVYTPDSAGISLNDRAWSFIPPKQLKRLPFPGTFDFPAWLAARGIFHEMRLSQGDFEFTSPDPAPGISLRFHRWRERLLANYRDAGLHDGPWAVMSALVLGYDDAVDSEVMQAFSATGTLHVLSVSGLHVGLVYGAIRLLLGFLSRRSTGKRVQQFLSLLFIWIYALLTGGSPAVLRAAAMLSLVLGSNLINRPAAVWNSLAASIFFLTVADPTLPSDVGFQLSYAAVAGILAFYPWLRERGPIGRPLLQRGWEFLSVSVSAQWFTFPLGLYYFHQFPNLFLITNAIIIPLSTLAMFAGLALLFLGPVAGIGPLMGWLLQWLMERFLELVQWMGGLPGAQTSGVWISGFQLACLGLWVVLIYRWFVSGRGSYLMFSLIALMLFTGSGIRLRRERLAEADFSVLPVRGSAYLWKNGKQALLILDSLSASSSSLRNRVEEHLRFRGIDPGDCLQRSMHEDHPYSPGNGWFIKRGDRVVIGKSCYWLTDGTRLPGKVGSVVVRKPGGRINQWVDRYPHQRLILDGTFRGNRFPESPSWYQVSDKGYFIERLSAQTN